MRLHGQPRRRSAFTVLELLVVMSIIALLASLISAALFRYLAIQPVKNTQALLVKLESTLRQQWQAVVDQASIEPIPQQVIDLKGGDQDEAKKWWILIRLAQEFPENQFQAQDPGSMFQLPGVVPPIPSYQAALAARDPSGMDAVSSALLYAALKRSRGVDFDADTMSPQEVVNNGAKYFVDAWRRPLMFQNGVQKAAMEGVPGGRLAPQMVIISGGDPNVNDDDLTTLNSKQGDQ